MLAKLLMQLATVIRLIAGCRTTNASPSLISVVSLRRGSGARCARYSASWSRVTSRNAQLIR